MRGIRELQLQFEQLHTEAKRLNAGEVGQLMIGMLEGQIMDDRLRNILRYFRQRYPELQLRMHRCTFRQLEHQLLNGELDLGITLQMEVEDNEDLCYHPYQSLKNYIILPKEHPLADKTDLSLNDFAGDAFLELEEGECHHISQMMNACCQQAGFVPKLFVCPDLSAQLFALETGLGVMVLNENHTALQNPHLVARSLEGFPRQNSALRGTAPIQIRQYSYFSSSYSLYQNMKKAFQFSLWRSCGALARMALINRKGAVIDETFGKQGCYCNRCKLRHW